MVGPLASDRFRWTSADGGTPSCNCWPDSTGAINLAGYLWLCWIVGGVVVQRYEDEGASCIVFRGDEESRKTRPIDKAAGDSD